MNTVKTETNISKFLRHFSEINQKRPTRMGVFEANRDAAIDYWLEDGLPLTGIVVEGDSERVAIQILLLNKEGSEKSHFTHAINDVRLVKLILSNDGESDGLDIVGMDGNTTVLRFENFR